MVRSRRLGVRHWRSVGIAQQLLDIDGRRALHDYARPSSMGSPEDAAMIPMSWDDSQDVNAATDK
jgi:hypothetical protein